MIDITYNPILEMTELSRIRLLSPIRPPRIGTALVLERLTGERVVIESGQPVPDPRLGDYHRSYVVDLARYGVKVHETLPSADPSFPFHATVGFACQVLDPVAIVAGRFTDMTAAVRGNLVRTMRTVAAAYDVLMVSEAETALNAALDRLRSGTTIRVDGFAVELDTGDVSEIHRVRRAARLDGMRRDEMSGVLRGGQDALVAQWLAKRGGDPSGLFAHQAEMKAMENEHYLTALRIVSASGEKVEGFDTRKHRDQILDRFLGRDGGEHKEPRRRLSKRARVMSSFDAEQADEATRDGEPAQDTTADDTARDAEPRVSRVRGTGVADRERRSGGRPADADSGGRPKRTGD